MPDDERIRSVTGVAGEVVSGLKTSPLGLALVVINMLFIGAALYFLATLAEAAAKNREQLMRDNAAHFELLMKLCSQRGTSYKLQSDEGESHDPDTK